MRPDEFRFAMKVGALLWVILGGSVIAVVAPNGFLGVLITLVGMTCLAALWERGR